MLKLIMNIKDPEITNARINNLVPSFGGSRRLPLLLSGQTVGLSFTTRWSMHKLHRKASVRCVNQSNVTYWGAYPIYPENRHCKCGAKISVYNGMDKCNPCWYKENFSDYKPAEDLVAKFETIMFNQMAGVKC